MKAKSMIALLWQVLCQKGARRHSQCLPNAGSREPLVFTFFGVYIMRHDDDGGFFSRGRRCWSLPPFIGLPMSCHRNQIRPINRSQIHAQPRQLQPLRRPRSWPGRLMKRESRRRWYELNPKSARQKKAIVTDQASGAKVVARPKSQCGAETKGMHNLI